MLAILIALGITASSASQVQQLPAFRARTDVVSVAVAVTKGRVPVTGLTPSDFDLTDNGVRQTVDSASLDSVAIDMTLVLTAFPADRTSDHDGYMAIGAATGTLLKSNDRLRVVTIDDDVRGAVVNNDYSLLADPDVRTWARGRVLPNGVAMGNDGRSGMGVALADGLFYALAWPVDPNRRHLVVAFTDGWDTASALEMSTVPTFAAHSDAVLHAVFWRSPGEDNGNAGGRNILTSNRTSLNREWQTSFNIMDSAVEQTGGQLHRTNNAAKSLAEIVGNFRTSYVLRYTPRGVPLPGWHELKVKLTRPGSFNIRARKGYEG
jgi:VWFA-related protein